tara:strand:- start:28 stop:549 length:522 start_codon:yes stop_codon:yes gene_type:complete
MGQEYFINSQELEDKVRSLLPSQGGSGAGFDLSASTQIIPIIDLTESAEGSNVREDLQTSFSFDNITSFNVANTTTTIINNTGYFRIFGTCSGTFAGGGTTTCEITLGDGATDKILYSQLGGVGFNTYFANSFDFIVFLKASDLVKITTGSSALFFRGATRQIATIDGTLVNP